MSKIKIEKGSVQETLILPLYGRKMAMELYPENFADKDCQELFERIDLDVPKLSGIKARVGAVMAAVRQYDMAYVCREYLKEHPSACVVNLGCGLDTTFRQIDNGKARGYNLDFPDVIMVRNQLLPKTEREFNIACDLNDLSWFEQINFREEDGAVFFASGVFYYFRKEDVKNLFIQMAKYFKGARIVFDATNAKGLKSMSKTWLDPADMKNVGVYFSVEDEKEIESWSDDFQYAVHKGYMEGYRKLDKRYGALLNFIFRYVDKKYLCQVIEIQFK